MAEVQKFVPEEEYAPSLLGNEILTFEESKLMELAKNKFKVLLGGRKEISNEELKNLVETKKINVEDLQILVNAGSISKESLDYLLKNDVVDYNGNKLELVIELTEDYLSKFTNNEMTGEEFAKKSAVSSKKVELPDSGFFDDHDLPELNLKVKKPF